MRPCRSLWGGELYLQVTVRQGLLFKKNGEMCLIDFVVCQRAHQPSKKKTGAGKEEAECFRADIIFFFFFF